MTWAMACDTSRPAIDRRLDVFDDARRARPRHHRRGAPRGSIGTGAARVRLPAGATVADLLAVLEPSLGRSPGELAGVAVAMGGDVVGRERVLVDGEAVALILPVAGG